MSSTKILTGTGWEYISGGTSGPTGPTGPAGGAGTIGPTGPAGAPGSTVASGVSSTPVGNIAANNVQNALAELDTEKANVSHTHAAADIASGVVDVARLGASPATTRLLQAGGATGSATWVLVDKTTVGLTNVDNTADSAKPVSTAQQTALNLKIDTAAKGALNGVASLDGTSKIPIAQIPTGTTSSTVTIGNDTRLSDARTPTAHNHAASEITSGVVDLSRLGTTPAATEYLKAGGATGSADWVPAATMKTDLGVGAASGIASLDSNTKVPIAQIPTGTGSTTVALGNDARFTDARTPNGAAGGALSGTYPNPALVSPAVVNEIQTTKIGYNPPGMGPIDFATGISTSNGTISEYGQRVFSNGFKPGVWELKADGGTIPAATNFYRGNQQWSPIAAADLTATGTKDATTYLRGDNTWSVPAGGGGTSGAVVLKTAVRLVGTINFSVTTGWKRIDTVATNNNERILLTGQTNPAENGIWVAQDSGSWARATDADAWDELVGAMVQVTEGDLNTGSTWVSTVASGGTLGTTAVTWSKVAGGFPTILTETANKKYVDVVSNLTMKAPVRVATTPAGLVTTYVPTLGPASNGQFQSMTNVVDGVTLAAGDRILFKDLNSLRSAHGIYVVTTLGTGANGVWDRAPDFRTAADMVTGSLVTVQAGTLNANTSWFLATLPPITPGGSTGTGLNWERFHGVAPTGGVFTQTSDPGGGEGTLWYDTDEVSFASSTVNLIPANGAASTVLRKKTSADYDTEWADPFIISAVSVTALPSAYPNGVSVFQVTPTETSWPKTLGTVVTTKVTSARVTQTFTPKGTAAGTVSPVSVTRVAVDDAWGDWNDTGWVTVAGLNSWTTPNTLEVRVRDGCAYLRGTLRGGAYATGLSVATVPTWAKPSIGSYQAVNMTLSTTPFHAGAIIYSTGEIKIWGGPNAASDHWVTGTWRVD